MIRISAVADPPTVIVGCAQSRDPRLQRIIDAFQPQPYEPYPLRNSHVQTVLSYLYPPSPRRRLNLQQCTLPTDDGLDTIHLHLLNGKQLGPEPALGDVDTAGRAAAASPSSSGPSKPVAVVAHGLTASSTSVMSMRIAEALAQQGFKVVLINCRGCAENAPIPKTFKMYHQGFFEDLETLVRNLKGQEIYIAGYSLGTAMLINMLGNLGSRAISDYGIMAAAGVSVPFDPVSCQAKIDSGLSHAMYSKRLVKGLTGKFEEIVRAGIPVPHQLNYDKIMSSKTIGEVDDHFVARMFGFEDRFDYYRKTDSRQHLASIAVPSYFITARDDPFFDHHDGKSLPTPSMIADAPVKLYIPDHGGHCGFTDYETAWSMAPTYPAREIARFFRHVHEMTHSSDKKLQ